MIMSIKKSFYSKPNTIFVIHNPASQFSCLIISSEFSLLSLLSSSFFSESSSIFSTTFSTTFSAAFSVAFSTAFSVAFSTAFSAAFLYTAPAAFVITGPKASAARPYNEDAPLHERKIKDIILSKNFFIINSFEIKYFKIK